MLKSKDYEQRFANFVAMFREHKDNIELAFDTHRDKQVQDIQKSMESIFRSLDTPHESEVLDLIVKYANLKDCIENEDILVELVALTGKHLASFDPTGTKNVQRGSDYLKNKLLAELNEDVDKACERHMPQFCLQMDLLRKQLPEVFPSSAQTVIGSISEAADQIIDRLSGGASNQVDDPARNPCFPFNTT